MSRTPPLPTLENAPLRDIRPVRFGVLVKAPLVGAEYIFDGSSRVDFRPINRIHSEAVYVFEHLTLRANVPEEDWISSLDPTFVPQLNFWSRISGESPTPVPSIPIVSYTDAAPYRFAWVAPGDPDTLQASVTGKVVQTPWMINQGVNELTLAVTLMGFEVTDLLWKDQFLKGWRESWVNEELGGVSGDGARSVKLVLDGVETLRERMY